MPDFAKYLREEREKRESSQIRDGEQKTPSFPNRVLDRLKLEDFHLDNEKGVARFGGELRSPHFEYAFIESARKLFDSAKADSYLDELGTVILYLMRHSLELLLKELIIVAHDLCLSRDENSKAIEPVGHDLSKLCKTLIPLLKKIDVQQKTESDSTLFKKIGPLIELVGEIHTHDPDGAKFRYPEDTNIEAENRVIFTEIGTKSKQIKILKPQANFPTSIAFPVERWLVATEKIFEKLAKDKFCPEVYPLHVEPTTVINEIISIKIDDFFLENHEFEREYHKSIQREKRFDKICGGLSRISETVSDEDRVIVEQALEIMSMVDLNFVHK